MIKTTISNVTPQSLAFPKLMRDRGCGVIILATGKAKGSLQGTVLANGGKAWDIGHVSETWNPDGFEDFHDVLELRNEK